MLSTGRWLALVPLAAVLGIALWMVREGLPEDRVLVSSETLSRSLPWSEVLGERPRFNRFVGDQARIYYPYLLEAARVYDGAVDALWTSRGGGGLPFLANATSSLLHPLTLLAAVLPVERVPLVQALLVLVAGAGFTYLFLRRLGLSMPSALVGAIGFGFGGHQVLWLQYALSHTLLALPLCFWAVERLREDRRARRIAVLALGFALLVFGGHPETTFVAALTAGGWALWRLWDHHGRSVVLAAGALAVGLSAVQWWPFLDYALDSHGMHLRELESSQPMSGSRIAAGAIFALFGVSAFGAVRTTALGGLMRRLVAVGLAVTALVMARRMGMHVAALTMLFPDLYGSPLDGGTYTGAQDYPGLNAGYVGALPALLLVVGAASGIGGGFVRFFAWGTLLLWGAAHGMPVAQGIVRAVPGLDQLGPTRLLGPVGFMTACGGALVLENLCAGVVKPESLRSTRRVAVTLVAVVVIALLAFRFPADPFRGRTMIDGLVSPAPYTVFEGDGAVEIAFDLPGAADRVIVEIDDRRIFDQPVAAGVRTVLPYPAQREEEGHHRIRVESWHGEESAVLADQPFIVARKRGLAWRDAVAVLLSLGLVGAALRRPSARVAAAAAALVTLDVVSFGMRYNEASDRASLYPPTRTGTFLAEQPGPYRVFTEGNILPPDTQFALGVDHLFSYDNLGFHRTYQWLLTVLRDPDAFARFDFSRASVVYESPMFDAMDVRYVLTDRGTDLSDLPGFALAHEGEARAWENLDNLGRAFVVGRAVDTSELGAADAAAWVGADPADVAFLERPWSVPVGGRGSARVTEHRGATIRVEASVTGGPALLVVAENWDEGWQASIDGGPWQPTWHCDVAWQAVPLEPGEHDVEFRYRPPAFGRARIVSLASAAALLLMLRPRRRR